MSGSKSRQWTGYIAGAAFALCAAASATAYAQTAATAQNQADADAAGPAQQVETHIERRTDGGPHMERREERRIVVMHDGEGHHHMDPAEHLRTMLQLKPGQEAALTAYLAAVKPGPMHEHVVEMSSHDGNMTYREHDGGHEMDHDMAKTTPERLADMEKRMADSQAEARKRIDATRKFYAQLDPSQKKVFDEMPMLMIGPIGPIGPMMMPGPMKIRFEHGPGPRVDFPPERFEPPIPPMPPVPPRP